jgi:hypothetical protein
MPWWKVVLVLLVGAAQNLGDLPVALPAWLKVAIEWLGRGDRRQQQLEPPDGTKRRLEDAGDPGFTPRPPQPPEPTGGAA